MAELTGSYLMYWFPVCTIVDKKGTISVGHLSNSASSAYSQVTTNINIVCLHRIDILTCKQPSRSSSSSFCTAISIPGTRSPSTPAMEIGDCRTTAATSCTVVLCLSTLPSAVNEGSTNDFNKSLLNSSGDDTGTN